MAKAWYEYSITLPHGQSGEKGIDLGTPFHTPITALYAGTVRWSGRTQWSNGGSSGGEITIVCNVPGRGLLTSYYLHTDVNYVKVGDNVQAGQVIALSGGQLSGGQWPVRNVPGVTFSTGPHTEFGFNAPWVSGPGTNIDPTFSILQARNGTLPKTSPDGTATVPLSVTGGTGPVAPLDPTAVQKGLLAFYNASSVTHRVITQPSGVEGICEAIDAFEAPADWNWLNPFGSILANAGRMVFHFAIYIIGVTIILFAIWAYLRAPLSIATNVVLHSNPATGAAKDMAQNLSEAPSVQAR